MIADLLLFAAALGAAAYCMILSRRLARLNSVDKGLGGAIAVLSVQVDDLTKALADARSGSEAVADRLATLMSEAETMANDIEEVLAVSHDFTPPSDTATFGPKPPETAEEVTEPEPEEDPKVEPDNEVPVFRRRSVKEAAE